MSTTQRSHATTNDLGTGRTSDRSRSLEALRSGGAQSTEKLQTALVATWSQFAEAAPDLAAFGVDRLAGPPAYLASVDRTGAPRVHPVTPIIGDGHLFVFMEPASPKGHDLRERGWYALHNSVPDMIGTGGEIVIRGRGRQVEDHELRGVAIAASGYLPADHYLLFELELHEATVTEYADGIPQRRRWRASAE